MVVKVPLGTAFDILHFVAALQLVGCVALGRLTVTLRI